MDQSTVDHLLERYLVLLDEYTRLRQELSGLQSNVYHNIARANFSAERGLRYGQDHYDERMQSSRLLSIDMGEADLPTFAIKDATEGMTASQEKDERAAADEKTESTREDKVPEGQPSPTKFKNPLHWFGLLVPMPLRTAQSLSIKAVTEIIPKLVAVNAEMAHLEIEVRRARKRRAKAEAAKNKVSDQTSATEGQSPSLPVEAN